MNPRNSLVAVLFLVSFLMCASVAIAQHCPATDDADKAAIYPGTLANPVGPLIYPMRSDRYAVEYRSDDGDWTDATVHISIYGGTNSSPFQPFTQYPSFPNTSMSFVSIPVRSNAHVELRVTLLSGSPVPAPIPFLDTDHVSVRPGAKGIDADLTDEHRVRISTHTGDDFAGEQFLLWWERDSQNGGAFQGLVFFLNPPYERPSGPNVKVIYDADDLNDVSGYDTLDFESFIAIEGNDPEGPGAQVFDVPATISNIFLGKDAWVQGKLRFDQGGNGSTRMLYGPGVLDVSRFNYMWRQCRLSKDHPDHRVDGLESISFDDNPVPDQLVLDGIVISDSDFSATTMLTSAVINNTKIISWNGNNDGFRMGAGTVASNIFVRDGDDSVEMWGASIIVTNATVWQNATGGVVNLGWLDKYPGDFDVLDGLYVVRTDWLDPTNPTWEFDQDDPLAHQDNGVIVSLMVPGTNFGSVQPPVYRNIFIDDAPRVLFSLKIVPQDCDLIGLKVGGCPAIDLTKSSFVKLKIENVVTPPSLVQNSIGFQNIPKNVVYEFPAGVKNRVPAEFTLAGTMDVELTNVFLKMPDGSLTLLTSDNAGTNSVGMISTNPASLTVDYDFDPDSLVGSCRGRDEDEFQNGCARCRECRFDRH